jgi:hypothetical protein
MRQVVCITIVKAIVRIKGMIEELEILINVMLTPAAVRPSALIHIYVLLPKRGDVVVIRKYLCPSQNKEPRTRNPEQGTQNKEPRTRKIIKK